MNIQNAFDGKTAKVGDKVWSIQLGDAVIIEICDTEGEIYPIVAQNQDKYREYYTMTGRADEDDMLPSLFYGPPDIIGPPKPKRMVKKTVELMAAVDPKTTQIMYTGGPIYPADGLRNRNLTYVQLTGEIEVEE